MSTIDLSNYKALLVQSTAGRVGAPDGNVFFDTTNGKQEFIPLDELATVDLSGGITTPAVQINVVASAGTFTRVSGSYLDEGFYPGRDFASSVFTEGGNNLTFTALTVTATIITVVDNTGLVDETGGGDEIIASVAQANPLIRADGIKFEASYAFENQERASSRISGEDLRKYDRFTKGTFKFGGAYTYVNGRVPSTDADRTIIRGSGWDEFDTNGVALRKYFGNKGLSNIEATSQPSFQQDEQGTATDFEELGQIDEAVLVYHDSNGDGTPDTVDKTTYEAVSIRTYGNTYDRKETTTDLGITELGGYSTGFALNEGVHLTTNESDHPYADVMTVPAGVWLTMQLEHVPSPSAKTGEFSDETGSRLFSWELANDDNATLDQMVAWLDAFATEAAMEADGLGINTGHLGKDIETWYYYNAAGQVVTKSGVTPDSEGLYLQNIPTADQQRVVMTDDGNTIKAYSFSVSVEAEIGSVAKADALSWFHSWFAAAFNTSGAIVVLDSSTAQVKGLSSTADGDNKIIFAFDYTGDTEGGGADTDKDCVFLCEGDGGATQAKTLYTITKVTTVAFTCAPGAENNV